jgi:tripartite-type tricarboxylate transporter receptor subunit TctC
MASRRALLAAPLALLAVPALAQARQVRLIVPFPGGGTMDAQARLFAPGIALALGATVIIDNRPGGGTVIGTQEAARAPGDGNTLLMVSNSFTINPTLHGNLPHDIFRDFTPLALTSVIPHALVVHPDVGAADFAGFVAAAKARPGALAYASYGTGTSNHLNTEILGRRIGAELTHVPYRGLAQWFPDLIQNRVQFTIANLPEVVPAVREGKLRAVAAAQADRVATLPGVPTLAEAGVPGLTSNSWFGIVMPAGAPAPVVQALQSAIQAGLARTTVRARLAELWIEPLSGSGDELATLLRSEHAQYAEAIRVAQVRPE